MKKMRFVFIVVVVALLLGSFAVVPGARATVAGTAPKQTNNTAFNLPALSPFLLSASAQVIAAGEVSPEGTTTGYACKLMGQAPADWTKMPKRNIFDATWILKNTGTKTWGLHGVDVRYRGDTRMHYGVPDLFDIPKTVSVGKQIQFTFDMMAPKVPGYYVSNWGLYLGSQVFCKFYVVVVVTR